MEEIQNLDKYINLLMEVVVNYGPKLIGAIIVIVIGLWIVKIITKTVKKLLVKSNIEVSLVPFLTSIVSTLLKIMVVISALGIAGIEMTSFIAILGAAGLAVGMALSGTLQNFAGGVMILLFKPFKVGEFISAQGHKGTVEEIQLFNTFLTDLDNKVIIIPNGGLSTASMVNYTRKPTRRVDWKFGVAYGEDIKKVKDVIKRLIDADSRILKDPEAFIMLGEMADSSINFTVRAWVNTPDYWGVFFDMNEKIYTEFNKENISIPFPQMDVHLQK